MEDKKTGCRNRATMMVQDDGVVKNNEDPGAERDALQIKMLSRWWLGSFLDLTCWALRRVVEHVWENMGE